MRNQYPGVVIGIVKDIDAANAAVTLEFPWLEESYRSDWAPVAMPIAGKKRGIYFMPEPDDHVLVAFNQGDFDSPYVVGSIWNGVATPPETDRKNRVIKTPGGHTLRFEDTNGSKKVILKSDGGHHITIDDTTKTITVSDSGGSNQVVIQSQGGTVNVKAATKVVVDAPEIELTSGATHPLVLGDNLLTYLTSLVTALQTHTHPGELAAGVLPVTPMVPGTSFPTYQSSDNSSKVKTG
jgi:uncharacterized protein involved in type VI secretion and phage assembly